MFIVAQCDAKYIERDERHIEKEKDMCQYYIEHKQGQKVTMIICDNNKGCIILFSIAAIGYKRDRGGT